MTNPSSRQRGRLASTKPQLSDSNKNLVLGSKWGLTPRLTGRLTVGHNVSLTLTLTSKLHNSTFRKLKFPRTCFKLLFIILLTCLLSQYCHQKDESAKIGKRLTKRFPFSLISIQYLSLLPRLFTFTYISAMLSTSLSLSAENFDWFCLSRDMPDGNRLLAGSRPFKCTKPNFNFYLSVALFWNFYRFWINGFLDFVRLQVF
jgi:hypothetical protein